MSRVGPSPCKDCTDRVVGCHSDCERYKTWKDAHEAERLKIRRGRLESQYPSVFLELWANEMEEPKE